MVLWFPGVICFVGLILSTACHIISVGAHLHWHFENLLGYNFILKHLLGPTSYTAIFCWSFFVVFPICKIVNEPWEEAVFFTQRLSQCCQITFDLGARTLLREGTGDFLGQPVSRGNTIAQVQFPWAGKVDWAFSNRLVELGSLPKAADSSGAYPVGIDQASKV